MDSVAFSIFGIDIAWYGILISLGVLIGSIIAIKEAKKHGITEETMLDFILWEVPLSMIGARVYYVIFEWDTYRHNPISALHFRGGGLAIHGGIIMAIIVAIVFTKKRGINFWTMADIAAPSLILGQAIGRWGNYLNKEAHGGPTDLPWGIMIDGIKVHPTFLYESLWNFLVFFFLIWYRKDKQKVEGELFLLYIVLYSFIRYFIEGLRTDSLMMGGIRVAQLVSIIGMVIGSIYFLIRRKKYKDK